MQWWNKDQHCYDVSFGTDFLSVYPQGSTCIYIYISYVFRYAKDSPLQNVLPTLRSDLEVMQENGEATPLTTPRARRAELIWCMILPVPRHQSLTGICFPGKNGEKWGAIKDDTAHKRLIYIYIYITLKTGRFAFHLDFNKGMGIVPCFLYNMISSRSLKAETTFNPCWKRMKAGENSCAIQYWIHPTPRMPVHFW